MWLLAGLVAILVAAWFIRQRQQPVKTDDPGAGKETASAAEKLPADDSETDLQTSMSSLPDAVMLIGEQWQLRWANKSAHKLFGIEAEYADSEPIWQLVTLPGFGDYLARQNLTESFQCVAPGDPQVWLEVRIVPYRAGQLLLQGRDITRVRQLEQIRRDFVANASHELRTPLSILYGYLEMMQEEPDTNISRQWKPAVRQMYEQTSRIKQIIDDMMLLSRLEDVDGEIEQQFVPMSPLMQRACEDARALANPKGQAVKSSIDDNYSLYCNEQEIQSLVMNLISNAIRYTPDNGTITVSWQVDLTGGRLQVSDTGIGIEQKDIPRLTERFYRTDPARSRAAGGTGLGLAIVNHIVNRHQAKLFISSTPGNGSEFTVQFPRESIQADHDQVNLLLN